MSGGEREFISNAGITWDSWRTMQVLTRRRDLQIQRRASSVTRVLQTLLRHSFSFATLHSARPCVREKNTR